MQIRKGQVLSKYEILEPLGSGTAGEVYLARDTRLGREVALKILHRHMADDEEILRRFNQEAKALASLHHPNIGIIYDFEADASSPFLVLEFVPGINLAERIAKGPVPIPEALGIARQVAEGLAYLHAEGLVHRDLKPANVMLTADGRVKILDFGLAKGPVFEDRLKGDPERAGLTALTRQGTVLGTVDYMSPEQAEGEAVDERTDVWAFACVLYELLTGESVFPLKADGESSGDLVVRKLFAIAKSEPDWSRLPKETPEEVKSLLEACLRKDRSARFDRGMAAIVRLLKEAEHGPRRKPVWIAVLLVVVAGLGLWMLRGGEGGGILPSACVDRPSFDAVPARILEAEGQKNRRLQDRFLGLSLPLMRGEIERGPLVDFCAELLLLCNPQDVQRNDRRKRFVSRADLGRGVLAGEFILADQEEAAGTREFQFSLELDRPEVRESQPVDLSRLATFEESSNLGTCAASRKLIVSVTVDAEWSPSILHTAIWDSIDKTEDRRKVCEEFLANAGDYVVTGYNLKLGKESFRETNRQRLVVANGLLTLREQSAGDQVRIDPVDLTGDEDLVRLCLNVKQFVAGLGLGPAAPPNAGAGSSGTLERLAVWAGILLAALLAALLVRRRWRPKEPAATATTISDSPSDEPREGFEGLMPVAGCTNAERRGDVVFVHGLDGDAFSSWHPAGRPQDYWPARLGQAHPELGVWSMGYAVSSSAWKGTSMPLQDRATHALALFEANGLGVRPLVFVCHSLGGLLVKQVLRQAQGSADPRWSRIVEQTRGVVFLSTPHAGSALATWLQYAKLLLPTVTVEELAAHDPQLRDLNKWYRNSVGDLGIESQVYFETRATRGLMVVNATSADPGIPGVNPVPIEADHVSICKPSADETVVSPRVGGFVERLLLRP